jgi:hypothetical protein
MKAPQRRPTTRSLAEGELPPAAALLVAGRSGSTRGSVSVTDLLQDLPKAKLFCDLTFDLLEKNIGSRIGRVWAALICLEIRLRCGRFWVSPGADPSRLRKVAFLNQFNSCIVAFSRLFAQSGTAQKKYCARFSPAVNWQVRREGQSCSGSRYSRFMGDVMKSYECNLLHIILKV